MAIALTGVAVGLRWVVDQWVGDLAQYTLCFVAVALLAAVWGWRSGGVAAGLGGALGWLLFVQLPGRQRDSALEHVMQLVLYLATSGLIIILAEWGRRQRQEARNRIAEVGRAGQTQAMLAAVVESSNDAIVSESLDGRIRSWNAGAARLFGYAAEEAIGRSVSMLIPESANQAAPEDLLVVQRGEVLRHEVERVRKDGSRIVVSLSLSPIRDGNGRIIGIAKIAHDITDLKQAQAALTAAMQSAESAKAAAERANQAKDRFLAVLSHELRTPLMPVLTTASLLEGDRALPPRYREDVATIRRNVELEARLIDDLLDVTRIERGKIVLDMQRVVLGDVMGRAVEVCRADLEDRGLHLGVDLGPEAPYVVRADPARLQQVLWNLLKNAIKFTPRGGCVGMRCKRNGNGCVVVEVSDSGEGIDPALLAHIFKPFEQGGAGVTRQFGGLGLGLTITKGLVEKHGGRIEAHSAGKGKGATFRVTLPIAAPGGEGDREARGRRDQETGGPNATPRPSSPLHILLVEDHGDTARIMKRLLRMEGHEVEIGGDVQTGLALAEKDHFDLLISDLGLPDGTGMDLLRTLRERGCDVPAIALSGYGQEQDLQRTSEAGFAAHLTKPVNAARLFATIAAVAGEHSPVV